MYGPSLPRIASLPRRGVSIVLLQLLEYQNISVVGHESVIMGGKGCGRIETKPERRLETLSSALSQMVQDCKMHTFSFQRDSFNVQANFIC